MRESGQPPEADPARPRFRSGPDVADRVGRDRLEGEPGRGGMGLGRGAFTVEEGLDSCGQVASGLAAVHATGLVRRDLEVPNVMVTPDRVVKLLDCGRARRVGRAPRGHVTRRGEVLGTPGWLAPGQLRGEEPDARSDVSWRGRRERGPDGVRWSPLG